jgi:hypothetical protein
MGLFDKIKSIANQVTGGAAKITLTVEGTDVKSPIKLHITAVVKDANLAIEKVYARAKSIERIRIPRQNLPGGSEKHPHDIDVSHDVFQNLEFVVSPAQMLEGGKTYTWTHELKLPSHANPSYIGKFSHHEWVFYAALDAKGNDPDSGWVTSVLK